VVVVMNVGGGGCGEVGGDVDVRELVCASSCVCVCVCVCVGGGGGKKKKI
jgi:hypothetical protein